jgi:hypothetical protein
VWWRTKGRGKTAGSRATSTRVEHGQLGWLESMLSLFRELVERTSSTRFVPCPRPGVSYQVGLSYRCNNKDYKHPCRTNPHSLSCISSGFWTCGVKLQLFCAQLVCRTILSYRTNPNNSPPNHTHHTQHTQPCLRPRPWKLASRRSLLSVPNSPSSNDNVPSAKRSSHRRVRVEMQQRYVEEGHTKVRPPLTQPAHLSLALAY